MSVAEIRKFTFEREFDDTGRVVREPVHKLTYTAAEVEMVRTVCHAAGRSEAEDEAGGTLKLIEKRLQTLLSRMDAESADLKREAADLALASARCAAREALSQYPEDAAAGLFAEAAELLRNTPRVAVCVSDGTVEAVRPRIEAAAARAGFEGGVSVEASDNMAPGDCTLTWDGGAVERRADVILERIRTLTARWLISQEAPAGQLDLFAAAGEAQGDNDV